MLVSEVCFNTISLWMRILNVPMVYRTKETTELLAKEAGEVLDVNPEEGKLWRSKDEWDKGLRVRVRVDTRKPLATGSKGLFVDDREEWFPFQ
uniref:DUF4283 domain-containing protein n=1 Tax=Nelumbo nucifera TaxID=4432 RepID=A0A822ZXM5_NELNU|nr:TPA_asm: hypothetical protein HUJ06_017886 [Nelumbo nucifera]